MEYGITVGSHSDPKGYSIIKLKENFSFMDKSMRTFSMTLLTVLVINMNMIK